MTNAKMFLFGRWMSICYSSIEMNSSNGLWWKEQLIHFNKTVLPNYIKNGMLDEAMVYLSGISEGSGMDEYKTMKENNFKNK